MSVYTSSFLKTSAKEEYCINIYVIPTESVRNATAARTDENRYLIEYLLMNALGVVDAKERIGDWEADTAIGRNHKGAIITLVERKSKYTLLRKATERHLMLLIPPFQRWLRVSKNDL